MSDQIAFRNWTSRDVEKTFGLERVKQSEILARWLASEPEIPQLDWNRAEALRRIAEDEIDGWNEPALTYFFIAPLVALINFNEGDYRGFLEQTLTVTKDDVVARGNVDFMVATGRLTPEAPFYLMHEYKAERKRALDPQGQLLIAMLAAQRENEAAGLTQPIYGTYVLGRFWFFVVLNGNRYTISRAFDCTLPDGISSIFKALAQVKRYIASLFAETQE